MDSKSAIPSLCVFHPIWVLGGGGGSQGGWCTTCLCSFTASAAQKWSSLSPLRGALPKAIEFLCHDWSRHLSPCLRPAPSFCPPPPKNLFSPSPETHTAKVSLPILPPCTKTLKWKEICGTMLYAPNQSKLNLFSILIFHPPLHMFKPPVSVGRRWHYTDQWHCNTQRLRCLT